MINWKQRYATKNIPSSCIFCKGLNHLLRTAVEWTPETAEKKGLPRPISIMYDRNNPPTNDSSSDDYDDRNKIIWKGWLKPRVPIPWASEGGEGAFPRPDEVRDPQAIREHLCPMCGEGFKPGEQSIRWKTNEEHTGESDTYPMHEKCMRQVRIFCPHMQDRDENEFERGPYEKLRSNADSETKN